MRIKEWIRDNVSLKREDTEVRDYKGYGYTLGVVGLAAGGAMAIIVFIVQMIMGSATSSETVVNIIATAIIVALLAYLVWLLLPMFKDSSISIGSKVLTTVIALASLAVPFIIGIYVVVLAVIAVIGLAALVLYVNSPTPNVNREEEKIQRAFEKTKVQRTREGTAFEMATALILVCSVVVGVATHTFEQRTDILPEYLCFFIVAIAGLFLAYHPMSAFSVWNMSMTK